MLALRYAALLTLAVWIGGIVALGGVAAPAIFDVVATREAAGGGALSGAIFGEILRRFHLVSYACGGIFLISLGARGVLGPRPRRFAVRAGIAGVMLAAALYSGIVVSGRIEGLREAMGAASPSSLRENDPRRIAFGRLHAWSTGLQLVPLAGALALLMWELRD